MSMKKEQAVASLYNLRSIVDGMVSSVKCGVLPMSKALEVIGQTVLELTTKDENSAPPEA